MSKHSGDAPSGADYEKWCRARGRYRRLTANALVRAMEETGTTIETIAARLGRRPDMLRRQLNSLTSGMTMNHELDWISDFAWALGCEVVFEIGSAQGSKHNNDGDTTNTGDTPCTP